MPVLLDPTQLAAILGGFVLLVFIAHQLGWLALRRLVVVLGRVPAWLRRRALYARLGERYPGLKARLAARLSPAVFTGLPLTLVAVLSLLLLMALAGIVDAVLEDEDIAAIDNAINAALAPARDRVLLAIFLWLTDLGAGPAITAVAITATGFLWVAGRTRLILSLWLTLLGAQGTSWAAKYIIGRERPAFIDVASAGSPSFPSGHSTASMAVYGFLAYALARHRRSLRARYELAFWAALLIALIGFSRMLLSVHYASDVLSGFIVGSVWLLLGIAVAESAKEPARPVEP